MWGTFDYNRNKRNICKFHKIISLTLSDFLTTNEEEYFAYLRVLHELNAFLSINDLYKLCLKIIFIFSYLQYKNIQIDANNVHFVHKYT